MVSIVTCGLLNFSMLVLSCFCVHAMEFVKVCVATRTLQYACLGSLPLNSVCSGTKVPLKAPPKDRRPRIPLTGILQNPGLNSHYENSIACNLCFYYEYNIILQIPSTAMYLIFTLFVSYDNTEFVSFITSCTFPGHSHRWCHIPFRPECP